MRNLWDNQLTAKQNLEKLGLRMDTNIAVDKEKIEAIVQQSLSDDHNVQIEEKKEKDKNNNDISNKTKNNKNTNVNIRKLAEEEEIESINTDTEEPKRVGYDALVSEDYSEITSSAKGLIKTEIRKALHAQRLSKLGLTTNPSSLGDQILTNLHGAKDQKNVDGNQKILEELFDVPIGKNGDVSEIDRNPRRRIMSEEDQLYVSKLIKKYKDNYQVCKMESGEC